MTDYGVLFRELAVPRLVGSVNHRQVREALKRELAARGFSVEEHTFSGRPARALLGAPAVVHGTNVIATRPNRPSAPPHPPVWLVAHYDSKGQPISMALRLLGFFGLIVGAASLLLNAAAGAVILLVAALIVSQNRVTDNSPGAVDNATALVAAFMTIDQLAPGTPVGVVFPDAEEFGLVGARALAAERAELFAGAAVINLDGLDDVGRPVVWLHRPGRVGAAVAAALAARGRRWLPVIVDGIALARIAGECLSILKGNWQTMRIVHRPADRIERVRLDGAAAVAAALARVLRQL